MNTFGDFRYVYHITDWSRTGRTIGVLAGVTIALVTFHAFFCLVARLVNVMVIMMILIVVMPKSNNFWHTVPIWSCS